MSSHRSSASGENTACLAGCLHNGFCRFNIQFESQWHHMLLSHPSVDCGGTLRF